MNNRAARVLAATCFALLLPAAAAIPLPASAVGGWEATATSHRGANGSRYTFVCAPNGQLDHVWGTDVYSDDSYVCSAAVHAGLISVQSGGTVTIEIRPGQQSYTGLTRYGVTSGSWGSWYGSFVFVSTAANVALPATAPGGWDATATAYRGSNGSRYTFSCPANGRINRVWGTDVYSDDSYVCSAAVHAGRISLQSGGTVTIEIRPGQQSYTGSTRYGVTSGSWGSWYGSFVFV